MYPYVTYVTLGDISMVFPELRGGSVIAKVYALLLLSPMSVSEISRKIYNGKVQLSHVERIINKLSSLGYIKEKFLNRSERANLRLDLRKKYWVANYKPFLNFVLLKVKERADSSRFKKEDSIKDTELSALEIILNSRWFKNLLKCECIREGLLYDPIQELSLLVEEIFAIAYTLRSVVGINVSSEDIVESKNFDELLKVRGSELSSETKNDVKKVLRNAKKMLGNYKSTNNKLNLMFDKMGVIFLPYDLQDKLMVVGRVPLTVIIAFQESIKLLYKNKNRQARKRKK